VAVVSVEGRDRIERGYTFEDWERGTDEDIDRKVLPSHVSGLKGSGEEGYRHLIVNAPFRMIILRHALNRCL
jgi:hypothetical protein